MKKNINKYLYWAPRVLSIIFILFLAMLSLDVFSEDSNFQQIAIGLFMHNIPTLILTAVVAISWKHEIVGGIVFILAGLLAATKLSIIIATPPILIGILFLIGWFKKRGMV